ncbi:MAG: ABC transporter ATP-binding protein [Candidatus Bathyarchaeota archaeon]
MPTIETINLSKNYGSFTAVSNLNIKLEGGKCVGFLGPNGAGKTTVLKMFTDLIRPTSGEALINGINVHTQKTTALESVGTLIEMPEIYPALTPREALTMIAEIRGVPKADRKQQIESVVSEVRMSEWIDKRVGKFSKGMKQRICVASSILSDPTVVLLDEPTTGLDPRGMSEVREIIKSLKNKKRLIFMSSHLLSEVSDVCDEVAIIDHGKLLIYDKISNVTSIVSEGENIVKIGLLNSVEKDLLSKISKKFQYINKVEKIDQNTFTIQFSGTLETQEKLLIDLVKMNIGIISYKPASSALEGAYMRLIKDTL